MSLKRPVEQGFSSLRVQKGPLGILHLQFKKKKTLHGDHEPEDQEGVWKAWTCITSFRNLVHPKTKGESLGTKTSQYNNWQEDETRNQLSCTRDNLGKEKSKTTIKKGSKLSDRLMFSKLVKPAEQQQNFQRKTGQWGKENQCAAGRGTQVKVLARLARACSILLKYSFLVKNQLLPGFRTSINPCAKPLTWLYDQFSTNCV